MLFLRENRKKCKAKKFDNLKKGRMFVPAFS